MSPAWRGVVEGYYGRPWPSTARRDVIRFIATRGMNAFVYGPKHDPWHRERWREPYPPETLADLAATAAHAAHCGVRFVWAIAPALDIGWSDPDDEAALFRKLAQVADAGIRDVALFLDDVPDHLASSADVARYGGSDGAALGRAHGDLARRLHRWLEGRGQPGLACVVPREYAGTDPSDYLGALCHAVPPGIPLGWTGPAVLTPTIDRAAARARRSATGGRPIALWDNYPVNDVVLSNSLHLGPLTGRDPALPAEVAWFLFNPMRQPYASLVALATAADYLRDPAHYDPERSWRRILADLDGGGGLALLARQLRTSVLTAPAHRDAPELAACMDAVAATWSGPRWTEAVDALERELRRQAAVPAALAASIGGTPLAAEIAPWVTELAAHTEAGLAAVALLRALRPRFVEVLREAGHVRGRVLPPDLERAERLVVRVASPPPTPELDVYLSALGDLLGPDPALPHALGLNVHGKRFYVIPRSATAIEIVRDRNEHDRVLAFAARAWEQRDRRPVPLRLAVAGRPTALDAEGRFVARCERGPVALVATTAGGAPTALVV